MQHYTIKRKTDWKAVLYMVVVGFGLIVISFQFVMNESHISYAGIMDSPTLNAPQEAVTPQKRMEKGQVAVSATVVNYHDIKECGFWDRQIDNLTGDSAERNWLYRLIRCESTCNTNTVNKYSAARGIIQFMPATYAYYGGQDIWNEIEQLQIGLKMYRLGEAHQWECK